MKSTTLAMFTALLFASTAHAIHNSKISPNHTSEFCNKNGDALRQWREARWLIPQNNQSYWRSDREYCRGPSRHFCIGDHHYGVHFPDPSTACDLFASRGISHLSFCGDSFMRHLYVAFVQLTSGDFRSGALWPHYPLHCEFEGQYKVGSRMLEGRELVYRGRFASFAA